VFGTSANGKAPEEVVRNAPDNWAFHYLTEEREREDDFYLRSFAIARVSCGGSF